jgi:hypothetical protein
MARLNPMRIVRTARRLIEAAERLPDLETKIEQCMVAYQKDARFGDRVAAFRAGLDPARIAAHVREAVDRAPLELDPCAHVVVRDLIPEDLYEEMLRALPSTVFFKRDDPTREEIQVPFVFAPAYSRAVWDVFMEQVVQHGLIPALTAKFEPAFDAFLGQHWPSLGSWRESGIRLHVSNSRLLLRRPGYVIRPHRDPRWAFLTCLVYLQKRDADAAYGTQLYRLRAERTPSHNSPFWVDESECTLVKDVPGIRNSAVIFLNSTGVHGASIPRDAPPDFERYVYQGQFSPEEPMKQRLIELLSGEARRSWTTKNYQKY